MSVFNQLMKWTIIVGLWRKYKSHVAATGALLLSMLLINYIHLDYIEFSAATGASNLGFSYLLKWSGFILAIVLYVLHIKRVNTAAKYDSRLHKMMKSKPADSNSTESQANSNQDGKAKELDPFANIRSKNKLSSEADFLIKKDK